MTEVTRVDDKQPLHQDYSKASPTHFLE